jgi:membrane glycosyltransferase
MNQAPKLAGIVDVLLTSGGARRYGGALRFLFAAMVEMVHSWVLGAVDSFRTTVFILGLLFGKSVTWGGQARDAHGVAWGVATSNLWPQTLFGAGVVGAMASQSTAFALWSLPITLGYLIAIPFCVISAAPEAGALLKRHGLFGVPEEFDTPEIVRKAQGELRGATNAS